MTKYVIGATGALLTALAGVWLMLAPFALAYQGSGADWGDPTYVDFWTGLPLLVVSVAGLILYVSGLVEELRRRGIMRRQYAPEQPQTSPGAPPGNASENNVEQILLPLVTAMLKDMQERDGARQGVRENDQQRQDTGEEGSVRR
ncbi:MAG: hypothetical protein M3317_10300 [Actinomycetota bacterium]|nr:hypothetical protein [Actinomycetota bacterium]